MQLLIIPTKTSQAFFSAGGSTGLAQIDLADYGDIQLEYFSNFRCSKLLKLRSCAVRDAIYMPFNGRTSHCLKLRCRNSTKVAIAQIQNL